MAITSSRAISLPAIIAGLGGGNAVGTNAVAVGATLTNSLSTGNATNPNLVFQVGVKTTSGAAQATATTALTIAGETLLVTLGAGLTLGNNGSLNFGTSSDGILGATAGAFLFRASGSAGAIINVATDSTVKLFARDGSTQAIVQAGTLALGGATIGSNALAVTGTSLQTIGAATLTINNSGGGSELDFITNAGGVFQANGGYFDWYIGGGSASNRMMHLTAGVVNLGSSTVGVALDVATNGILKVRNIADSADAAITAGAATFSGVLKINNARSAGIVAQGGTVTIQDSTGATIQLLCA